MPHLIITDNPAREAGEKINSLIQEHVGDVVCLLAGGSALGIIEHIRPGKQCFHEDCASTTNTTTLCQKTECRTIFMTGDERVSGEEEINNFLQIRVRYQDHPVTEKLLETVPHENESEKDFAERIESAFLETLTRLQNPKIIFILGVGTDGHTAGIFPMAEESFRKTYQDDRAYVPVQVEGLTIDSRASFTPTWILNHADALIGFVTGSAKKDVLIDLNQTDKKLYERPAELLKLHKNVTVFTDQDIS